VNVAARLRDLADPGDVLVSQSVHGFVEGENDAEVMPRTELRGRREPMDVFRLRRVDLDEPGAR
jgi:class 3 adenylate cyclase